jgi:hypothetical protein
VKSSSVGSEPPPAKGGERSTTSGERHSMIGVILSSDDAGEATVMEINYREAIQLILNGIDQVDGIEIEKNREPTELFND